MLSNGYTGLHALTNGIIIGICLSISFGLVCFKQMAHAINPKDERACRFFIAASLIIAAGPFGGVAG